jgi:hypothetical protein
MEDNGQEAIEGGVRERLKVLGLDRLEKRVGMEMPSRKKPLSTLIRV